MVRSKNQCENSCNYTKNIFKKSIPLFFFLVLYMTPLFHPGAIVSKNSESSEIRPSSLVTRGTNTQTRPLSPAPARRTEPRGMREEIKMNLEMVERRFRGMERESGNLCRLIYQ